MSHYVVAVITKDGDYDKALAPFDEQLESEPYIYYTKAERIAQLRKDHEEAIKRFEEDPNSTWLKWLDEHYDFSSDDETLFKSYVDFMKDDTTFDEDGNELSTYNKNSKWDWYQVGGRWDEEKLRLKNGEPTNHAQVKDIAFTPQKFTEEEMQDHRRYWEIFALGQEMTQEDKDSGKFIYWGKRPQPLETYDNFEEYVKAQASLNTYAILLHGEWIAPGEMGWFGMDDATPATKKEYKKKLQELVDGLDPEDWITIVDCHI